VLAQLDDDGTQRQFWRVPTQAEKLVAQVRALAAPDKRLALEESNLARWLWQLLRPHVAQLVVCDARHNKLISSHHNKKDPRNAFGLARLFRLNELKPVWQLPTDERAFFKSAAQSYEEAVLRQTQLKQQIKSTFQHWGFFPTGTRLYSPEGRGAWLKKLPHADLRAQVELLYASSFASPILWREISDSWNSSLQALTALARSVRGASECLQVYSEELLALSGCFKESMDERVKFTPESAAFRLKERADEKWMLRQFNRAHLTIFPARDHFQPVVFQH